MKITKKVAGSYIGHDVLHRGEGSLHVGRIMHGQKNSSNKLKGKKQSGEGAKASTVVKVAGGRVVEEMI